MRTLTCSFFAFLVACAHPPLAQRPPPVISETRVELTLPGLDGRERSLAELRGKVVLLDVWATWCKPCVNSFPFYARLARELGPAGFEVLAVSVDQDDQEVRRFLEQQPVPFTILRDSEGRLPMLLDVETMPTAALLGRDGRLLLVHAGFLPDDEPFLEREIRAALSAPFEVP